MNKFINFFIYVLFDFLSASDNFQHFRFIFNRLCRILSNVGLGKDGPLFQKLLKLPKKAFVHKPLFVYFLVYILYLLLLISISLKICSLIGDSNFLFFLVSKLNSVNSISLK